MIKRTIFIVCALLLPTGVWADHVIVFKTPEGVAVTHPTPKYMWKKQAQGMTEQEVLDEIAAEVLEQRPGFDPAYSISDKADIPSNRRFRNAWAVSNGKVVVDPAKAETVLAKEIEREATDRIDSVVGDERQQKRALARAARLNAEVAIKKRSLTVEEQNEVDQLIAVDDYVQAVRDKAAESVAGLDGLTQQEKLDFNASTDVAWPAPPGK